MLMGSNRYTCHPHVYTRMVRAILPLLPAAEHHPTLAGTHFQFRWCRRLSWPALTDAITGGEVETERRRPEEHLSDGRVDYGGPLRDGRIRRRREYGLTHHITGQMICSSDHVQLLSATSSNTA